MFSWFYLMLQAWCVGPRFGHWWQMMPTYAWLTVTMTERYPSWNLRSHPEVLGDRVIRASLPSVLLQHNFIGSRLMSQMVRTWCRLNISIQFLIKKPDKSFFFGIVAEVTICCLSEIKQRGQLSSNLTSICTYVAETNKRSGLLRKGLLLLLVSILKWPQ